MGVVYPREVIIEYIRKYITEDYLETDAWVNIKPVFSASSRKVLGFNIENNFVNDFKLGTGWPLTKFVQEHQQISETEANTILMKIFMKYLKGGIKIAKKDTHIKPVNLPPLQQVPPLKYLGEKNVFRNKIGSKAARYLISRDMGAKHIKKYNLSYSDTYNCFHCNGEGMIDQDLCPICKGKKINPYYGWLIIPSYEDEKLVYFQARNLNPNDSFRYRNPSTARSQVVFFYDEIKENDSIFITEGPFDAMTLVDYSSTCVMGNRLSEPQAQKLFQKKPKEIIFVPDWDKDEETRRTIANALKKNIITLQKFNPGNTKIGIYMWYKKYGEKGKDINAINHTKIEKDLILYRDFKQQVEEKFNEG